MVMTIACRLGKLTCRKRTIEPSPSCRMSPQHSPALSRNVRGHTKLILNSSHKVDDTDEIHTDPTIWASAQSQGLLTVLLRKVPENTRLARRKKSRERTYAMHKDIHILRQKTVRRQRQQTLKHLEEGKVYHI